MIDFARGVPFQYQSSRCFLSDLRRRLNFMMALTVDWLVCIESWDLGCGSYSRNMAVHRVKTALLTGFLS